MVKTYTYLRALEMSEELQNGDVSQEQQAAPAENQNLENQGAGSELAPGTEGQQEQNPPVDEAAKAEKAQAATQKVISEKHFQAKQAERERDEALAKVAKFEQDQREAAAQAAGNIPPLPDEFDDDFQEKMVQRDEAIVLKAQFDATQATFLQQQQFNQQQAAQQKEQENQKLVFDHRARATNLGVGLDEIAAAENTVLSYGLQPDCLEHVLSRDDSPLLIKHLAANPTDGIQLASMSPFMVGTYLDGIKAKTDALKPKQSNTPAPPDQLTGSGAQVDLNKYPNSKGATFS